MSLNIPFETIIGLTGVSICVMCVALTIGSDGKVSVKDAALADKFHTRTTSPADNPSSAGFNACTNTFEFESVR